MKNRSAQPPQTGQLRIIGGQWRGRKLTFPSVAGLRPTGDRLRETLFNWLQVYNPGARVLDLFAGSGALGLEALSRGAAEADLLELNGQAAHQLRANCALLGANARVHQVDSLAWLQQPAAQAYDLIFLDPPFGAQLWDRCLAALAAGDYLAPGGALYLEAPRDQALTVPSQWPLHRQKLAGNVSCRLYLAAE